MAEEMAVVIALDQGTHSSRASAWTADGICLREERESVDLKRVDRDRFEQSPDDVLGSVQRVFHRLVGWLAAAERPVRSVGLAVQRSSVLCWRRSTGAALTPVLSWMDTRAAPLLRECGIDVTRMRRLTGLYPSAHAGASKLAWCVRNEENVAAAARQGDLWLGPLAAFLVQRLTASTEPVVDPCNGARTLLWDRHTGAWSEVLLEAFGLDRRWLPKAGTNVITDRRLDGRWPLTVCTGDQSAVPFAVTQKRVVNLGTGAFVMQRMSLDAHVDGRLLDAIIWQENGRTERVAEGTVNGAGLALSAFARERDRHFDASTLERALADAPCPPPFLNTVGGLGSPDWATPRLAGYAQPVDEHPGLAGVAESIVFGLRRNTELLGPAASLAVTGGLAASDLLCQRLADALGSTVTRPKVLEATSRGLADRLWREVGGLPSPEAVEFSPREDPALEDRYIAWTRVLEDALAGEPMTSRPGQASP